MPTIGGFHAIYWKQRANPVIAAGTKTGWMYPGVQSVVTCGLAIWGVSFDLVAIEGSAGGGGGGSLVPLKRRTLLGVGD